MLSGETIKLYLLFYYREVNGTVVAQLSLANNCLVFFFPPMSSYFFCKKEKNDAHNLDSPRIHTFHLFIVQQHRQYHGSANISTPTRGRIKHKIYEILLQNILLPQWLKRQIWKSFFLSEKRNYTLRMNSLCCVCWSVIGIVIVNLHTFVLDSLLSLVDILEH